jgi:CheY-like chemotaxis protein
MKKRGLNIFLVEDNAMHCRLVNDIIKYSDVLSVDPEYGGHEVYDLMKMGEMSILTEGSSTYRTFPKPDLIILDMMLGGLDGWGVLASISKNDIMRKVPIIITSALSLEGCGLKEKYPNVKEILCKPLISSGIKGFIESMQISEVA